MERGTRGIADEELTAFIGRERELGELRRLAPGARALTLCGAGGIGKTRLAVRLIAELAGEFPDGACFVELADLRQPELLASRIASVLGIVEEPGRPLIVTLADALRSRRVLLGLDTCEHLIDACARACQHLLASSPGLRVIATSREPLRVAAETVWQVPPLSLPPPNGSTGAGDGADPLRCDALRLFAERAAAAKPGFALGPANLGPVTAICRELDGLPLAIELAAAWVRVLTVEQIAARLSDRFRLLTSAGWTTPPRHRELRAAIDWSHDLLAPQERVLMRRLSVFAGWTLDMAEQVCAGQAAARQGAGAGLAAGDVVDLLTALADKSLVIAEPDGRGRTRYRMLDTVREYAAARLAEAGEADLVHGRFRDYAVREVEQSAHVGMAQAQAPWSVRVASFRRFEAESGNLRQVLGRCLADGDTEAGLRICASMRPVWIVQGSFAEGADWLDAFLRSDTSELPAAVLGSGLISRAQLALATDPALARDHALAGLELCRAPGSEFWAGSALNLLAEMALHAGNLGEAAGRAEEALALATAAGDRWNEGYALGTTAIVAGYGGDLTGAGRLGEAALAVMRQIDHQWGAARALLGLGDLARLTGDPDESWHRYLEALGILRELSARPEIARCLAGLGRLAASRGEPEPARQYLTESLELSRSVGSRFGVIRALDAFAELAAARNDPRTAVRLAAAAAALRREAGLPPRAGRARRVREAAAGLGEEAVDRLWAEGAALGSDAAVTLALGPGEEGAGGRGAGQPGSGEPASGRHGAARRGQDHPGRLTVREREIVALVTKGHTNRAIAGELGISQATAARHVANVMGKLGVSSRLQIAAWALREGGGPSTDRGTGR